MKLWNAIVLAIIPVSGWCSNVTNYFDPLATSGSSSITSGSAINVSSISATSIADSALTYGSVVWASNGGLLATDSLLTYNGSGVLAINGQVSATNVSATNIQSPGTGTQLLYTNGGLLAGIGNTLFNSATSIISTTNTVYVSNLIAGISATLPAGTPRIFVLQQTDGPNSGIQIYNQAQSQSLRLAMDTSSQPCIARGASCMLYLNSSGVDVRATVSATTGVYGGTLSGQIVSATQYLAAPSPTAPTACSAATRGALVFNAGTSCMMYCNGTAYQQMTSVAGSCT